MFIVPKTKSSMPYIGGSALGKPTIVAQPDGNDVLNIPAAIMLVQAFIEDDEKEGKDTSRAKAYLRYLQEFVVRTNRANTVSIEGGVK